MNSTNTNPEIDEVQLLAQQAEHAKAAAFAALQSAKLALQKNVDPRIAVRRHPILSIGSATLAGFIAIWLAVPSKQERELRRLERLNRALHPETTIGNDAKVDGKPKGVSGQAPTSIWSSIIHEIVQLLRPLLMTAITAGVKSAIHPEPSDNADRGEPRTF